jgi:hypothetical protein
VPVAGLVHADPDVDQAPDDAVHRQLYCVVYRHMCYYNKQEPLCRHHHRVKQAQGWQLTQLEPGVLVWRTPAGRTHTTTPTVYPI